MARLWTAVIHRIVVALGVADSRPYRGPNAEPPDDPRLRGRAEPVVPTSYLGAPHASHPRRALKGTPHLWLDVARLCEQVLPRYEVTRVKYFTALVRPAPHDLYCGERRQTYPAALTADPWLEVHLGYFRKDVLPMPRHPWRVDAQGNPETVLVKRTLEKGSDVNLATHLMWDALHDEADAYAVPSNDSDLVTPILMLQDLKSIDVGAISPTAEESRHLSSAAGWHRSIRTSALEECALPTTLQASDGAGSASHVGGESQGPRIAPGH